MNFHGGFMVSIHHHSFDNSGERLSFPGWHSNNTNVQRTDSIIKTIASMFKDQTGTVPIIAPLNE